MAEKIVKICDCCKVEVVLFNTVGWAEIEVCLKTHGNPEPIKYDICRDCISPIQCCLVGSPDILNERIEKLGLKPDEASKGVGAG